MTSPIIAAIIVPRALSTFALSPPEVIHRMPPQIRKKRAISAAATSKNATAAPTKGPILFAFKLQSCANCPMPFPHGLTLVCAKAEDAKAK